MAIDFAAEASLVCGCFLMIFSVLNFGKLICFISYLVMVGFATAAAMIISLSQLKNVFGFGKEYLLSEHTTVWTPQC
jgi:MFS superfamily sulfate permease-like transporter